jgi:hypothetical protein
MRDVAFLLQPAQQRPDGGFGQRFVGRESFAYGLGRGTAISPQEVEDELFEVAGISGGFG